MAYIYALIDSRSPEVWRYIGKTTSTPEKRLLQHLRTRELNASNHRATWSRKVLREGGRLLAVTVEECSDLDVDAREIHWISTLRSQSDLLTNLKSGGEGGSHSEETKRKMSEWRTGRKAGPMSEKNRLGISAAKRGKPLSPAQKAGLSLAKTGIKRGPMSADTKAKMAEAKAANHGKLNAVKAEQIFASAMQKDKPQSQIAREYGVSTSAVERIVAGSTWAHLKLKERFAPCF